MFDRKQTRVNKSGNDEQGLPVNVESSHRRNPVRTLRRTKYSFYGKKLSMFGVAIQKLSRLKLTIALESVIITGISRVENQTDQINL